MKTWIKIGMRNLLKNRRRSLFTIAAIALGLAAINMFGGFTAYIYESIENGYIYLQSRGHLTVFKKGFLQNDATHPGRYLLSANDIRLIEKVCRSDSTVEIATPELRINGLIGNGEINTIFTAIARVPSHSRRMRNGARGPIRKIKPYDGGQLEDDEPYAIGASRGLAEKLHLGLGDDGVVMGATVDGQMNALDVQIRQLFEPSTEILHDKMLIVPLAFARELCDITGADRVNILLKDTRQTATAREMLERKLRDAGLTVEIRTWEELRPSYVKIRNMFNVIFLFVFIIVFIIVVLSVVNTISMAVMERTREIGTVRSLGLTRPGVVVMFGAESLLLGLFGSLAGVLFTLVGWGSIKLAELTWIPPTVNHRIPLEVFLVPEYLVTSCVFLTFLAMVAAIMPARRAARMAIIDALGHV